MINNIKNFISHKYVLICILIIVGFLLFEFIINANNLFLIQDNISIDDYASTLLVDQGLTTLNINLELRDDRRTTVKEYIITNDKLVSGYLYNVKQNEYVLNFVCMNNDLNLGYIRIYYLGKIYEEHFNDSEGYLLITDKLISQNRYNSDRLIIEEMRLDAEYVIYEKDGTKWSEGEVVLVDSLMD